MNDSLIINVDLEEFDELVLAESHRRPGLVDLWADWCSPCLVIAPLLKRLIEEYDGEIKLAKVEVDMEIPRVPYRETITARGL